MKKLMVGVMMVFAANAATADTKYTTDDFFRYSLDTETKTATLVNRKTEASPTAVDIVKIEYSGETYTVTAIGKKAFQDCGTLTSVSLPNVKEIPVNAFSNCTSLAFVLLPKVSSIGENAFFNCPNLKHVVLPLEMKDKVEGTELSSEVVSYVLPKEVQVVGADEVAVKLTELQAAKAEMVKVEGGVVTLGVSVCSNANCQAESKSWGKVKFTKDDLDVNEDGTQIIIRIPVDSQQGFMILQSGDAKVEPVQ